MQTKISSKISRGGLGIETTLPGPFSIVVGLSVVPTLTSLGPFPCTVLLNNLVVLTQLDFEIVYRFVQTRLEGSDLSIDPFYL